MKNLLYTILWKIHIICVFLQRYEDQDPEDYDAILTKDFDKFDMILQAEHSSFNWFFIGYNNL